MSELDTWDELVAAHRLVEQRHNADRSDRPDQEGPLPEHQPVAAVLACSDARVPPSVVFDQPAGRLFVVRIAGNTSSPAALASLDYAVANLGVELVVVLGHTGCGAVDAALSGTCGGHLAPIVEPICRLAKTMPDVDAEQLVTANVADTVLRLTNHDGPVGKKARSGRLRIQGAVHDLSRGHLDLVDPFGPSPNPSAGGRIGHRMPQEAT